MLPCHSCYIYGTWRNKEVGGLKLSYGGKLKGESHKVKWGGGGGTFYGAVDPSSILLELPTYFYDMHYIILLLVKT